MNCHIIIGWLGGNSEVFISSDFRHGRRIAAELKKSAIWIEIYAGSLVDLINALEGAGIASEAS